MIDDVAVARLSDIMRPKSHGDRVNSHVIRAVKEPQPDFEAMRLLVIGHWNVPNIASNERIDKQSNPSDSDDTKW
ncbi:hypothetical protein [Rhodovarius lipocyclicus]|uniref:hypothetical protein n=1 Tax=Rhodovarius lipocyclicus TaxID=268410 RepID=UPI001356E498|nr:hypothetical protein [Rhodovarius lipocyclicus]